MNPIWGSIWNERLLLPLDQDRRLFFSSALSIDGISQYAIPVLASGLPERQAPFQRLLFCSTGVAGHAGGTHETVPG
jgi:hypothetical protein